MERSPATLADMPALTALRAVAALLVFVYHFAPKDLPYLPGVVVGQGHVGVTVFFVLSGFLITVRYYPQFAGGRRAWSDYFVRRAARILPLYYVVLALTHLLSSGSVPFDAAHLPEWTLTQALFGASLESITVPTSWSLTVEECFYASAPLVFIGVAALRRRLGAVAGTLLGLGAASAILYLAGSLILHWSGALGPGAPVFLYDEPLLRHFTVFGRFPDFAAGAAAGFLFLSGRVEDAWRRKRGALLSTLLAMGGAVLLVAGQAGMVRDTGDAPAEWRWNLVVVAASAVIVIALTCREAPLSRLLSPRPAVYLGRISYALYLIQLTPLGQRLLYHVLPGQEGVHPLVLYAGMSLVAALLFEVVEEPAREAVLALWRKRSLAALPPARTARAHRLSLAILLGGLLAQPVFWVLGSLPPVEEVRVVRVLGAPSDHLVRAIVPPAIDGGREPRVRLPASWRLGRIGDRRAPLSLLVFVDGQPVRFLGVRLPADDGASAYYRRPGTEYLSLQVDPPATVTVVHHAPPVAAALAWSRLMESPATVIAVLLLLAAAAAAVWRSRGSVLWEPRISLAFAVALAMAWLAFGIHRQPWAPLVLALELAALGWAVLARRLVARRAATAAEAEPLSAPPGRA
jgi:peptidoglycan/LPS O-acetylase OafA/YrhL